MTGLVNPEPWSKRAVINNSLLLSVYYVFEAGLLFVLTLLLARFLGVAEFGRLAFAFSYGLLLAVLSDAGLSLMMTKRRATQLE